MQILCAFITALLAGLGVGGGGLFVICLTLIKNLPQRTAQGINLLFFLFSSGASLFWHARHRRIPWLWVFWMVLGGLIGAYFGARFALHLSDSVLRRIFGLILIFSGLYNLFETIGRKILSFFKKNKNISRKTLYK